MRNIFGIGMLFAVSSLFAAHGQTAVVASPMSSVDSAQQAPAPIVRGHTGQGRMETQFFDSEPAPGVSVRGDVENGVQTVTSSASVTELRVVSGRADVTVHHPENHSQILVDLPKGQVSLVKDGLYTFNASTNTVRVLRGAAQAYVNAGDASKGTKVKETQQVAFFGDGKPTAVNAYRYELTADLLGGESRMYGDGDRGYGYYGDYPVYAFGYGYPFGYGYAPYGYGYPFGVGLGFGYYGGFGDFHGGGFRGGFRR